MKRHMAQKYFELFRDRWIESWLIVDVDAMSADSWLSRSLRGERFPTGYAVPLAIKNPGPQTDLTTTPLGTLIATAAVAQVFCHSCGADGVQSLHAKIDGGPNGYRVIYPLRMCNCIDVERSTCPGSRFPAPFVVLDSSRIVPSAMFITKGRPVLVIRQDLKEAIEGIGAKGARFKEIEVI